MANLQNNNGGTNNSPSRAFGAQRPFRGAIRHLIYPAPVLGGEARGLPCRTHPAEGVPETLSPSVASCGPKINEFSRNIHEHFSCVLSNAGSSLLF